MDIFSTYVIMKFIELSQDRYAVMADRNRGKVYDYELREQGYGLRI